MDDLIKALKEISERDAIYGVERLVKQGQKLFPDARNLRQAATEALKTSSKKQIFSKPPDSTGKVTATFRNEIWQIDVADLSTYKQTLRGGHDYIVVAVDVFSRFMYAEPLKQLSAKTARDAFLKMSGSKI